MGFSHFYGDFEAQKSGLADIGALQNCSYRVDMGFAIHKKTGGRYENIIILSQ